MTEDPKIVGVDMASGPDVSAVTFRVGSTFMGMQVISSDAAVVWREDWSDCRSPSRARRRARQGHKQRVQSVAVPTTLRYGDKLIVHPTIWRELAERFSERANAHVEEMAKRLLGEISAGIARPDGFRAGGPVHNRYSRLADLLHSGELVVPKGRALFGRLIDGDAT